MESKKYNIAIDIAKMCCIFLVVSYHIPTQINGDIFYILCYLRMPLFFFVSGYLFKSEKYTSLLFTLKRKGKQLLIPYFSFAFIFYIVWLIIGKETGNEADISAGYLDPIYEFLWGNPTLIAMPLWFLICLFTIQIIYYLINHYIQNRIIKLCLILLLPLISMLDILENFPWELKNAFYYIIFYALGNMYKNQMDHYIFNKKYLMWSPIFLALFLLSFYGYNYKDNIFVNVFNSLSIILFFLYLCYALSLLNPGKKTIQFFAYNSIIILCLHNHIIGIIKKLFNYFCHIDLASIHNHNIIINASLTLLVILIIIPCIIIINNYLPFLIGRNYKLKK